MHTTEFHFPEAQKLLILLWSPVIHFQVSGKQGFRLWIIQNRFWNVGNCRHCSESTTAIYGTPAWEIKVFSSLGKFWWIPDRIVSASMSRQDSVLRFCGGSYFFTVARTVSCDKDAPPSTILCHMISHFPLCHLQIKSIPGGCVDYGAKTRGICSIFTIQLHFVSCSFSPADRHLENWSGRAKSTVWGM